MKKVIRLTESDLHRIIKQSISKILKEDVLGNDWHETSIRNNYEPFDDQIERYEAENEFRNQHDWGAQGESEIDPTFYEDPDWYRDDVMQLNDSPSDGDLYRGSW